MKNRLFRAPSAAPALSILIWSVSGTLHAQVLEVNPVVISANRMEQPLSQSLSSLSVITRADIDRSQAMTLADLLQGEAGFEFGRNGGAGTTTSFFLRGQNSTNLVLMIDGVRAQTDSLGSLTQTDLPLSQIERIEILRGNAGALYGDAAIGGVISIHTRNGKGQWLPYGAVSYGAKNTQDLSVGYGGDVGGKKIDLNAGTTRSHGFSSMNSMQNPDTNTANNGYSKRHASFRFEELIHPNLRLGARLASTKSDASYDKNNEHLYLLKTSNESLSFYARQQLHADWFSTLDLTHSELKYEDLKNNNPFPVTGSTPSYLNGKQDALRWGNVYEVAKGNKINFGIDLLQDKYTTSGDYGYKINRQTQGYFGGLTSIWDAWTLQANLRRDQIELDNTANLSNVVSSSKMGATASLLGAGYQLTPTWRLTASTSTGFRAPTAYDISTNALVKQENFKSQEAGLVYSEQHLYGRVAYFQTTTTNAITYVNYLAVNTGETKNRGLEATIRSSWFGYNIKLSAVHQNPWNVTDNKILDRRAQNYGTLDVSRGWAGYEIGTRVHASGRRGDMNYNVPTPTNEEAVSLPSYALWSFYASKKLDDNWTARVRLENATDKKYQLAYGYNTPSRGLFASLQYSPK